MKEYFKAGGQGGGRYNPLYFLTLFYTSKYRPLRLRHYHELGQLDLYLTTLAAGVTDDARRWAEQEIEIASQKGVTVVTIADSKYPHRLFEIEDPPLVLFVAGTLPEDQVPVIGIVGTRNATPSGIFMARRLGERISAGGGVVVSGLALGIDEAAHNGALEGAAQFRNHPGIAVIGAGLDQITPFKNHRLKNQILAAGGAVVSEYGMTCHPTRFTFPQRNRIISGLTEGVIVVEAKERSGALITARTAIEQGRELYVIPGSPHSPVSLGSNRLMRDGAVPIVELNDLEDHFEWMIRNTPRTKRGKKQAGKSEGEVAQSPNDPLERSILSLLKKRHIQSFDELLIAVRVPANRLGAALGLLETNGAIYSHPGGLYSVTPFIDI